MPRLYAKSLVLLLAAIVIAALFEFSWLNWLRSAEARSSDFFVAAQAGKIKPDPDIVVVAADEPSLEQLADYTGRWPWPRSVHGEMVQGIEAPGGYVLMTRGMLALLETESELAGVLGHEISHVVRKHHLRWAYVNKDMQASSLRFEAYQRPRYAALHAEPTDHPEPLQRLKMLDLALRARAEMDTLGDVGNERYFAATHSLRDRGD